MGLDFNFNFDFDSLTLDKLYKDTNKHGAVDLSSEQKNVVSESSMASANKYGGISSGQSETLDLTSDINSKKTNLIDVTSANSNNMIDQQAIKSSNQSSSVNIEVSGDTTYNSGINNIDTVDILGNGINTNSENYISGNSNNSVNIDMQQLNANSMYSENLFSDVTLSATGVTEIIDAFKDSSIGKKVINGIEISKKILDNLSFVDLITEVKDISIIEENGIKYIYIEMKDGSFYKFDAETGELDSCKTSEGVFKKFDLNTGEILYIVTPKGATIAMVDGPKTIDFTSFGSCEYVGKYLQVTDENGIKYVIPLSGFERNENGVIQIPYTEEEKRKLYDLIAVYYDKIDELSETYDENFKTRAYNNLDEVIITKFVDNIENGFAGVIVYSDNSEKKPNIAINLQQMLENRSNMDSYVSTFTHELTHLFDNSFKIGTALQVSDSIMWTNVFNYIYNEENSKKLDSIDMAANQCEWFARTIQIYYKNSEQLKDIKLNIDGFPTLYDLAKFLVQLDDVKDSKESSISYITTFLKTAFETNKQKNNKVYITVEDFILEDNDGNIYAGNGDMRILELVLVINDAIIVSINGIEYILKIADGSKITVVGVKDYIN